MAVVPEVRWLANSRVACSVVPEDVEAVVAAPEDVVVGKTHGPEVHAVAETPEFLEFHEVVPYLP